jgi:hypothetical protein
MCESVVLQGVFCYDVAVDVNLDSILYSIREERERQRKKEVRCSTLTNILT